MIFELVKRDPTWRLARYVTGVFALAGLLLPSGMLGKSNVLLMVGCFIAGLLQSAPMMRRSTLFYAALPLSGRQLFLARVIVCLSLATGPFVGGAAVHAIAYPADGQTSLNLLAMGAVFAFTSLCILSLRIEEFAPPARLRAMLPWLAGLAAPALYWPATALPILAFASLGCLIRWLTIWPRVPASFQAAPIEAAAPPRAQRASSTASPAAWWALARASISWQALLMVPVILLQALFLNAALAMLIGFAIPSQIRMRTRWLTALPMSPRALLALILLPYLLPLAAGYTLGQQFGLGRDVFPRFVMDVQSGKPTVKVPLEYWRHAPDGVAPVIQAPWGETFQPRVSWIFGYAVYNPYASGANSDRFQYWQYSRAAEAVYGEPLTFDQVEAGRRDGRLTPEAARAGAKIFGVALLLAVALASQWALGLAYWRRLPEPPVRQVVLGMMMVALFGGMGLDFWFVSHGPGSVSMALFNRFVREAAGWQMPVTLAVAALLAIVPWWLVERQFRESETPDPARLTNAYAQ